MCEDLSDLEHADYIIHAASQATPYYFENDPVGTIEANTLGTSNILQYACREKALGVLMISSLKVYGEVKTENLRLKKRILGILILMTIITAMRPEKERWKRYAIVM